MFDSLKAIITHQNLAKIRANQQQIEHFNQSQHSQQQREDSSDEDLAERIERFKTLIRNEETVSRRKDQKQHYSDAKIKQYQNQRNLFEQEMKIAQQMHQKQLRLAKQISDRQIQALKIEISKYELIQKKHDKEQATISNLKKDNRRLVQLHQEDEKIIQKQSSDISNLKKELFKLKTQLKNSQQRQAELIRQKHVETSVQSRLKEQKVHFQKQKAIDTQKRKQLQQMIHRLRQQKEDLLNQIQTVKAIMKSHQQDTIQQYKLQITRIQNQNKELKNRNTTLEQTFIEHLTQTSQNLQQTLRNAPQKINKSNTLYLQESPIRARSRDNQRVRTATQNDNPEPCNADPCKCHPQISRLKSKLNQANTKIVELLKQKCLYRNGYRL